MVLRLQRYELITKYKPGKEMVLADTLSSAYNSLSHTSVKSGFLNGLELVSLSSSSPAFRRTHLLFAELTRETAYVAILQ
jgi:hypothetical protein